MIYTAGITSCTENRYVTEHGLHSEIGLPLGQLEATISLTNRLTSTRLGKSPAESSTGQMGSRERVDPTQSPFFVGEKERSRIGTRMETFADPQSATQSKNEDEKSAGCRGRVSRVWEGASLWLVRLPLFGCTGQASSLPRSHPPNLI